MVFTLLRLNHMGSFSKLLAKVGDDKKLLLSSPFWFAGIFWVILFFGEESKLRQAVLNLLGISDIK